MRFDRVRARLFGLARRVGSTRPGVPAIGRVVPPTQRWLFRLAGGRFTMTGRAPPLLLTVTGRRAGKDRTVPLFYVRGGDRLVICNVNPGFEDDNPWIVSPSCPPVRPRPGRWPAHRGDGVGRARRQNWIATEAG